MTPKARDQYLRRKYRKTAEWYDAQLAAQNGGCGICGSRPITRALPVDHDHKWKYLKLDTRKNAGGLWQSTTSYRGRLVTSGGFQKKNQAVQALRKFLKELSVRGILCVGCNTGLRKFRDNPTFLTEAASYLKRWVGEQETNESNQA